MSSGIEDEIENLAGGLPDGYVARLCVENGSAWIEVETPEDEVCQIEGDRETCWSMLMRDALYFALHHHEEKGGAE